MGDFLRVHCRHCQQTYVAPSNGLERCSLCLQPGGVVSGDAVLEHEVRSLMQAGQVRRRRGPYPVSARCPECGGAEFRTVRPERWVAFLRDRVCKECDARYTPPTPVAGAVAMLAVGMVMLTLSGVGAVVSVAVPDPLGLACEGLVGVLGVLAAVHGVRSLMRPGKV
jgi:hypothetical protein